MKKPRFVLHDWSQIERPTIAQLIERGMQEAMLPGARAFGRSKVYTMRILQRSHIGSIVAADLKAMDVVAHCRARKGAGILPATLMHDYNALRVILKTAKFLWDVDGISMDPLDKAKHTLDKEQLIGKSVPRDRRPTPDEMERIAIEAADRMKRKNVKIPLSAIFEFSYTSGRRISETCRLKWGDVDFDKRTCIVRDLKNAKGKGFHGVFPLLGRSWDLIMAQPRHSDDPNERIFPYLSKSCGAAFREVCRKLGITNLRLHDQRRECFSRLFEEGYNVPEVQKVSLHANPTILLKTYTALKPEDLHLGPAAKRLQAAR